MSLGICSDISENRNKAAILCITEVENEDRPLKWTHYKACLKKCRYVITMHQPFVAVKKEHDFCSGWLCWLLLPKLPHVIALSMWAVFEKAVSSVRPERLCPLMSHGSFYLSMLPLWRVTRWRAPQWQSMLGYMDCESLSCRCSLLLRVGGTCC